MFDHAGDPYVGMLVFFDYASSSTFSMPLVRLTATCRKDWGGVPAGPIYFFRLCGSSHGMYGAAPLLHFVLR